MTTQRAGEDPASKTTFVTGETRGAGETGADFAEHGYEGEPTMPNRDTFTTQQMAVVSRATGAAAFGDRYLVVANGRYDWTADPRLATTFESMREAARMALKLPSTLRAFGLLRDIEVDAHLTVH
jgi:hypothetical protein